MQRCYSAEYEDRELREGLPKIIKQYIEEVQKQTFQSYFSSFRDELSQLRKKNTQTKKLRKR